MASTEIRAYLINLGLIASVEGVESDQAVRATRITLFYYHETDRQNPDSNPIQIMICSVICERK